jgi:hypothetical protein
MLASLERTIYELERLVERLRVRVGRLRSEVSQHESRAAWSAGVASSSLNTITRSLTRRTRITDPGYYRLRLRGSDGRAIAGYPCLKFDSQNGYSTDFTNAAGELGAWGSASWTFPRGGSVVQKSPASKSQWYVGGTGFWTLDRGWLVGQPLTFGALGGLPAEVVTVSEFDPTTNLITVTPELSFTPAAGAGFTCPAHVISSTLVSSGTLAVHEFKADNVNNDYRNFWLTSAEWPISCLSLPVTFNGSSVAVNGTNRTYQENAIGWGQVFWPVLDGVAQEAYVYNDSGTTWYGLRTTPPNSYDAVRIGMVFARDAATGHLKVTLRYDVLYTEGGTYAAPVGDVPNRASPYTGKPTDAHVGVARFVELVVDDYPTWGNLACEIDLDGTSMQTELGIDSITIG